MKALSILLFADLHYHKEISDKCFKIIDFIKEKAIELNPDFITNSGDLLDKAIMNSDTHGLPELKRRLDELSKIAPIMMIYGTQSKHDIPGSLEVFKSDKIHIVYPEQPLIIGDTIFYCIPDSKKWEGIDTNPLMAAQIMNKYLADLCLTYAAHRLNNMDKRAVVLGHGIVKNYTKHRDEVVNKSEIYVLESGLKQIKADVYLFGHYHKGYEFETIPGRMLGGFAHNWNDLDYYPAIWEYMIDENFTEFRGFTEHRIPFIPRRKKIGFFNNILELSNWTHHEKENVFNGDLIHFEKSKDDTTTKEDLIAAGAHPDSIVTIKPEIVKVIRNKEIVDAATRTDEYKLYAKQQKWEVSERELQICAEIEKFESEKSGNIKREIWPLFTHVKGFNMFITGMQVNEVKIDWFKYNNSLLGILGNGGQGKSALLSCIPPHSVNIAQAESFNNMFSLPDSFIIQEWKVNDDIIKLERYFEVKKKTTVIYKISVNGIPQQQHSGSKSAYDNFVYDVFGSARMFALNVYHTQFRNDKIDGGCAVNPDICTADNAFLKDIFTELLNIDRTFAYNYSSANLKTKQQECADKQNEVSGFKSAIDNPEELEIKIGEINQAISIIDPEIFVLNETIQGLNDSKELLEKQAAESNTAQQIINTHNSRIAEIRKAITEQEGFKNYNGPGIDDIKKQISALEIKRSEADKIEKENQEKEKAYNEELKKYGEKLKEYHDAKLKHAKEENALDKELITLKNKNDSLEVLIKTKSEKIDSFNDPCEHCGKLPSKSKQMIEILNNEIEKLNETKKEILNNVILVQGKLSSLRYDGTAPIKPESLYLESVDKTIQPRIDALNIKLQNVITMNEKAAHADQEIERLNKEITSLHKMINEEDKKIIPDIKEKLEICKLDISDAENKLKGLNRQLSDYQAQIKSLQDRIDLIAKKQEQLKAHETELEKLNVELSIWQRMAQAWGRNGIPAMILENAAPEVDQRTNDLLEKYYPELMIETSTIRPDATGKRTIEDFNIFIINLATGMRFPISGLSGEQRNFILTAFREVCRRIYERTANRCYYLGIIDEGDASVCEQRLSDYWNMVKEIDEGKRRLRAVTTHQPAAKGYFQESVEIRSLAF